MWFAILIAVVVIIALLKTLFVVVEEKEEGILERFGQYRKTLRSGFHLKLPAPIEQVAYRHETREQVLDIPPQECITKDNVQVMVDGLIYLKVMDVYKASYNIDDYRRASVAMAQATMRSEIGKLNLDDTFSERDAMNDNIVAEIDQASAPWGVKVLRYEVKNISPSPAIIKNMEQKMESERLRREENIRAEGERDSVTYESEGKRQADINISEGVKQKLINESEGRAREISLVAEASAQAVKRVAEAASRPGGDVAIRTQLVQQFIRRFRHVLQEAQVSMLPTELAGVKSLAEVAFGARDSKGAEAQSQAPQTPPRRNW